MQIDTWRIATGEWRAMYAAHCKAIGRGDTEAEAIADLDAQKPDDVQPFEKWVCLECGVTNVGETCAICG